MERELQARVRNSFAKQGLMSTLGAEVRQVEPGYCTIRLPYSDRVTQQHGFFHGGTTASLADTAAGFASYTLMDEDQQPLTVEFKINFIAPAHGDALEARATVMKSGYRLKHVNVEVYALSDEGEVLIALVLATVTASKAVRET